MQMHLEAAVITCEGCNRDLQISNAVNPAQSMMLKLLPDVVTCPHCGTITSTKRAEMREIIERKNDY
jgi:predicted  nucleic acid-binding Zn-ribbon protein